jgi:signal transduction histidine kinase
MDERVKPEQSARAATDQSLVAERQRADEELAKRRTNIEEDADKVVADARDLADGVVRSARAKADEELRHAGADSREREVLEEERSQEDDTLREARAAAAGKLLSERAGRRRALAVFCALERDQTDDRLNFERDRADVAIGSRDDFLGMVSHDLRNMLGAVDWSAASLTMIPCDDEVRLAIGRQAQRIQRCTAHMNRLISDLLDVVSIDAGRLAIIPQDHDVTDVLRETVEVFQPVAAAKNISIQTDVRAGPLGARYDDERILQVLANLVGNAIKFTHEGGTIDIVVEPAEHEVRFAVADTGAGIAPDKLGFVFERFWQVANPNRSGLGLGLYISKCIVEGHGGRIWVESRLHEGSTFYFTLPHLPPPVSRA